MLAKSVAAEDWRLRDAADLSKPELEEALKYPDWRIRHLYWIIDKDKQRVLFRPWPEQEKFLRRLWFRNIILKARQRGFCLEPATRVLTADLRWVAAGDITVGAELVAVDETTPGGKGASRKMRTATVQATAVRREQVYRIVFDDGRSVICTGKHRWLSKLTNPQGQWSTIEAPNKKKLRIGTQVRWITHPWSVPTPEDGWFGGLLDGEGSFRMRSIGGADLAVSQVPGPVLDRARAYLEDRGYVFREEIDRRPAGFGSKLGAKNVHRLCVHRMNELFRLLGQAGPTRFQSRWWEGRDLPGKRSGEGWSTIVSIEPLDVREVIDLQTSAGTFIAEGFVSHNSTLIQLMMLDTCLFNDDTQAAIIAQDQEASTNIFRFKIKYAYDNLPPPVQEMVPLVKDSEAALILRNGSQLRVATSVRSGTLHWLHVSEFGKICAQYPAKAEEVLTGSLPAVTQGGIVCIESTAEGPEGAFHDMSMAAQALAQSGRTLSKRDYRHHFAAWWDADEYETDPALVTVTNKDHAYFDRLEVRLGIVISPAKRAWYVATRDTEFVGNTELMFREYPSTEEEAFQRAIDGVYLADQLARARREGRIGKVPYDPRVPVNTWWDLGLDDSTSIWFHQRVGLSDRFIRFLEGAGEPYDHYVRQMQSYGYIWGKHYLPHDGDTRHPGSESLKTVRDMLEDLGLKDIEIVPRTLDLVQVGIPALRGDFHNYWFDEDLCKEGINHLTLYRKRWNKTLGAWMDDPRHDEHCHAADGLRQKAQWYADPQAAGSTRPRRRNRSGMAA